MTANNLSASSRIRFYGSLEAAMVAWAALMIAIGGTFGVDRLPLYIATLGGMLLILGAAMKHPVYRQIKGRARPHATRSSTGGSGARPQAH